MAVEPGRHPALNDPSSSRAEEVPARLGAALAEDADERCVREVLAGRRERFEDLVIRYQGIVYTAVLAYLRDAHRAEDLAQEVFVSAFSNLAQLREAGRFLPWLLQIARNRAARELRSEARRLEQPVAAHAETAAPESEPERLAAAEVFALVEELPEPYRETVLLKYRQNLSCKEIAAREQVPIGTVTSRLTRALAVLRTAMGRKEE